jgi:hypothetical protein
LPPATEAASNSLPVQYSGCRDVLPPPIRVFPAFASYRRDAARVKRRIPIRTAHLCGFFLTLVASEAYA